MSTVVNNPFPLGVSYEPHYTYQSGGRASGSLDQEILHAPIPADPGYPSHPAPEFYDAFVIAMNIGHPMAMDADGTNYLTAEDMMNGYGGPPAADRERKADWFYNFPEGTSIEALVNKAYAAFNWYGPLPVDQEDETITWKNWAKDDNVQKERRIFYYSTSAWDRDADFDLTMVEYGFATNGDNAGNWIWPDANGTTVTYFFNRGGGQWKAFFDLNKWLDQNSDGIRYTFEALAIMLVSVVTLGTGGVVFGALVTAAEASRRLAKAIQSGDTSQMMNAAIELGKSFEAVYTTSGVAPVVNDAMNDLAKKIPNGAAWITNVARPFAKLYQKASVYIDQGMATFDALAKTANENSHGIFPKIDPEYWKNAIAKEAFGVGQRWALKAQNLAKDELSGMIASVPWYAQGAAAFGATIRSVEIAQGELPAGQQMHFGPVVAAYDPRNPTMMQLKPELAALIRANWASQTATPDQLANEKAITQNIKKVMTQPLAIASPTMTPVSTTTQNVVIGSIAGVTLVYFFRDYIFGRLLDGVFKK